MNAGERLLSGAWKSTIVSSRLIASTCPASSLLGEGHWIRGPSKFICFLKTLFIFISRNLYLFKLLVTLNFTPDQVC